MPAPDYELSAGTIIGEVRNEVYNKHGPSAYENAKYGWHHEHVNNTVTKMYTLVSGSSVQFLLGTITYPLIERKPLPLPTGSYEYYEEVNGQMILVTGSYDSISSSFSSSFVPDIENPSHLEFLWYDADIPFLDKDVADKQGLTYLLK